MDPRVKEATGYVAWCDDCNDWKGNLATTPEDALASLEHHLAEDRRHQAVEETAPEETA
jgi:hypothetical protein